ncbi:MAG: acetylxylan esterase, partial [Planctomycetes bacterium]|nr:acetylxylan esterase [Planctomycetota bacterium]
RGMLVLNPEWLGMGQLSGDGYRHGRMNQLDLCGTSGLGPFYLAMSRGLDVLLALEHADPERVAVSGLSGGGWQTIIISSLDTRVKLTDPVAGYSSFRTRVRHFSDLGDSEQTPCDLATVADYAQLTALMAPRPTLLTFNAKDDCCFAADHALPPLLDAARPIFQLYGKELNLRWHVNHHPGNHNFDRENREAFYRMLGDFFCTDDKSYSSFEIPSEMELKTKEEVAIELPAENANFQTLAMELSQDLPRTPEVPSDATAFGVWRQANRAKLREVVRAKQYAVQGETVHSEENDGVTATCWRLKVGDAWTVPAVELVRGEPKGTVIHVADAGRASVADEAGKLVADGMRVLAVDPFYFGESKIAQKDYLFALLLATVGDRALGIQASQLAAIARWTQSRGKSGLATIAATGPRSSTIALVAAGLEDRAIGGVRLRGSLGSLKEVIEKNNWSFEQAPELFCFGLLEAFDIPQLAALVAPRPVKFETSSAAGGSQ